MSIEKKIFAIRLYSAADDINKRWFIAVKVPDYIKGCFTWKKCYGDINKYNTVQERWTELLHLQSLIETTQNYNIAKGSRKKGYINENYFTDAVYQLKQCLQLRKNKVRISSYRKYTGIINNMERWLIMQGHPNTPVGGFTNNDARGFLSWVLENMSHESYNAHLQLLKSFFEEMVSSGMIESNPFKGIRKVAAMSTPAMPFNRQHIELLKSTIRPRDPQLWLFVQFIYYCFIRPGELRMIRLSDIDFYEGKVLIRPEINKNKKYQLVSIPTQLMQVIQEARLQEYPEDYFVFGNGNTPGETQVGTNSMKNRHRAFLRELKFGTSYKLYSWKHTGAVACARAGMPLKELQLQLRHHSLDQVNTYLQSMLVVESEFVKHKFPEI